MWVLAVGLGVAVAGAGAVYVEGADVARHRAETAADMGALAAAGLAAGGESVACAKARVIVRANQATPRNCALDGLDAWVGASVPYAGRSALAVARAGPDRAGPDIPPPADRLLATPTHAGARPLTVDVEPSRSAEPSSRWRVRSGGSARSAGRAGSG